MEIREINKESLNRLLDEARRGQVKVRMNCAGGEIVPALEFVKTVRDEGLENNLSFEVLTAGSAATFVLLSVDSPKRLLPNGIVSVHGGRIEGEVNEVLNSYIECARTYYKSLCDILELALSGERMSEFYASNMMRLTVGECEKLGMVVC